MINFNGILVEDTTVISVKNRGYKFGDGLFETIKIASGKILFWEDHYFRLMASMRIMRIEIPMHFTMEFLEDEVKKLLIALNLNSKNARVRITIDRGNEGGYLPKNYEVNFSIVCEDLDVHFYKTPNHLRYEVDLFKDHFIAPGLLSSIKSSSKIPNILASIYAAENDLQNCLLLNTDKNVIEATNGNLFLVKNNLIKTPAIEDGCLNGILRKQLIGIIKYSDKYEVEETSISPFELQKADELFITNVIMGIQPITKYRKKEYNNVVALDILEKLNSKI
ncbi:aminotransferase class IV [Ichthyenterobacterium sp. W332]|uniref:branched-chain-amino-acid transaminase n=1 Tax=Microcosmobacter mediterraneus TaxID=3075607 RepID=A0ABU2YQQ7_9FLAO|nr:aminotransferase class IV [Ichthyenterobacterium sp. W332]MDT0559408.1 aminotransferase class IV [Ichthyenterobacterium sp. W332]